MISLGGASHFSCFTKKSDPKKATGPNGEKVKTQCHTTVNTCVTTFKSELAPRPRETLNKYVLCRETAKPGERGKAESRTCDGHSWSYVCGFDLFSASLVL